MSSEFSILLSLFSLLNESSFIFFFISNSSMFCFIYKLHEIFHPSKIIKILINSFALI